MIENNLNVSRYELVFIAHFMSYSSNSVAFNISKKNVELDEKNLTMLACHKLKFHESGMRFKNFIEKRLCIIYN